MYANFGINNFEATIRKSTFGFIQSTNSLIMTIAKSWSVRIDIWIFLAKNLLLCTCYSNMNLDCKCLFYYLSYVMYVNYDMFQLFFYLYLYFYTL